MIWKSKNKKEEKEKTREMPFVIKVFEKYVESWFSVYGIIQAKPKNAVFHYLTFMPKRVALFETRWCITAIYTCVNSEYMNTKTEEVYRKLKGMECELEVKGLLKKAVIFKPHHLLIELKTHIPNLTISQTLSQILNGDQNIIILLKHINPVEMTVTLDSIPPKYQPFLHSHEAIMQGMLDYYNKPLSITWIVSLSVMLPKIPGLSTQADNIFQVLNRICVLLKRMTEDFINM
jgi:hypothetical protein